MEEQLAQKWILIRENAYIQMCDLVGKNNLNADCENQQQQQQQHGAAAAAAADNDNDDMKKKAAVSEEESKPLSPAAHIISKLLAKSADISWSDDGRLTLFSAETGEIIGNVLKKLLGKQPPEYSPSSSELLILRIMSGLRSTKKLLLGKQMLNIRRKLAKFRKQNKNKKSVLGVKKHKIDNRAGKKAKKAKKKQKPVK